ncbi:AfsR/SARP family transcriptional regulator [Sphingomonas sp. LR61]|uniref:AfsR/SARP family transcriptional regulator n=1 Tax=Sphingomonas sp. LR61 TaxID=3050234 RepID=UPI003FA76CA2
MPTQPDHQPTCGQPSPEWRQLTTGSSTSAAEKSSLAPTRSPPGCRRHPALDQRDHLPEPPIPRSVPRPPPSGSNRSRVEDEEWLTDVRERLQLLQTQALEVAAERLIAAGRTAEALPYALSAVQAQPWSESTNRLIIEIHARRGDPSNALRRYHRFRRALEEELGVQPGPDMLAAIRQLYLRQHPSGTRRTTHPAFERRMSRPRNRCTPRPPPSDTRFWQQLAAEPRRHRPLPVTRV